MPLTFPDLRTYGDLSCRDILGQDISLLNNASEDGVGKRVTTLGFYGISAYTASGTVADTECALVQLKASTAASANGSQKGRFSVLANAGASDLTLSQEVFRVDADGATTIYNASNVALLTLNASGDLSVAGAISNAGGVTTFGDVNVSGTITLTKAGTTLALASGGKLVATSGEVFMAGPSGYASLTMDQLFVTVSGGAFSSKVSTSGLTVSGGAVTIQNTTGTALSVIGGGSVDVSGGFVVVHGSTSGQLQLPDGGDAVFTGGKLAVVDASASANKTTVQSSGLSVTASGQSVVLAASGLFVQSGSISVSAAAVGDTVLSVANGGKVSLVGGSAGTLVLQTVGSVTVGGNLLVQGTTTTIESTTVTIADPTLILASTASPTDVTASGAGLIINGSGDKTFLWSSGYGFQGSDYIGSASGKGFKIAGNVALDSENCYLNMLGSSGAQGKMYFGMVGASANAASWRIGQDASNNLVFENWDITSSAWLVKGRFSA